MTTKERVVLASAHFLCTNCNQEAVLLQTDCTTCYIDQNLVNCCTIVGKGFTTNPHEIEVMQLEHRGRRRCSKLCASSHTWHVDRRKCGRQALPSMNLLWQNLSSRSIKFGTELQRKIPLIWRYPNFLTAQRKEAFISKPVWNVQSFRYETGLWQTHRHMTTSYMHTALAYKVARWRVLCDYLSLRETWRYPRNRTYRAHSNAARRVPSHGNGNC